MQYDEHGACKVDGHALYDRILAPKLQFITFAQLK